jgi:NADPH-dependent 2,4-dienoyl-CoA reductase/sulfur reductase-like enzyme
MKQERTYVSKPQMREDGQKQAAVSQPRIVIVGAGFGGLEAAKALRNAPVQVTVITW